MKDESLTVPPSMTAAQAAVSYLLQRCQVDADLRHHMLNTEAFHKLCVAEAIRIGQTVDQVERTYSTPADHCRDEKPKLVLYRKLLETIAEHAEDALCHFPREKARELCKTILREASETP